MDDMLAALAPALAYAARGWLVMPAHTLRPDGTCTCRVPECGAPGKHPTLKDGVKDASRDPDTIRRWFESWPVANVAIVTGRVSNLFVVDASATPRIETDPSPTYEWDRLRQDNGDTESEALHFGGGYRVRTGSGSLHTYYRLPDGIELPNTEGRIGSGISTRGEGGYVIAPPSKHRIGVYRVDPLVAVPDFIPTVPAWLVDLVLDKPRPRPRPPAPRPDNLARAAAPTGDEPPPVTDADLAPVVNLATREQMQTEEALERAEQQASEPKAQRQRPIVSRSPLALFTILSDERGRRSVTGSPDPFRLNEITQEICMGTRPVRTSTPQEIRIEIEREYQGDDKGGGLKFSLQDVEATMRLLAEKSPFHPVRAYLQALKWDGEPRIEHAVDDILGAERTPINVAMFKRWLVSAVARAMKPGCKVDSMLVLTGAQGARKSTFFETLASPEWYATTTVDVRAKDAASMMHTAWIVEWAELKAITRAQDDEAVKAFLTTGVDAYRPPYGRTVQRFPRTCVICGTSNPDEFLTDDTGNRRFWPIHVGDEINLEALGEQRDQLWAEAVALYSSEGRWWLTAEESAMLGAVQERHERLDAWDPVVLGWVLGTVTPFYTVADVLRGALEKPAGLWGRADEMRVAAILKRAGWTHQSKPRGWRRPSSS